MICDDDCPPECPYGDCPPMILEWTEVRDPWTIYKPHLPWRLRLFAFVLNLGVGHWRLWKIARHVGLPPFGE